MKILVVLACVAVASARPEAPLHGYNYAAPRPQVHSAVSSSGSSGGHGYYQGGGAHTQSFGVSSSYQAAPAFHSGGFGSAVSSGHAQSAGFGSGGHGLSGGFGSGLSGGHAQSFAPQQTVVQKHIYVHVPPQEPEETRSQQIISTGVPRKHYKIIFIKTPNVQPSAAQIALQQAQQEEKTIVYVLVKKPEDHADINIPSLAPLPPSKPEVYFIKYKANRGSGVGGGVSTAHSSSSSSSNVGFDSSIGSASAGSVSSVGGGGHGAAPHTEYGAPAGGHPGYH